MSCLDLFCTHRWGVGVERSDFRARLPATRSRPFAIESESNSLFSVVVVVPGRTDCGRREGGREGGRMNETHDGWKRALDGWHRPEADEIRDEMRERPGK